MLFKEKYSEYLSYLRRKGMSEKTLKEHSRFLFGAMSHSIEDFDVKKFRIVDVALVEEAGKRHGEYGSQRSVCVLRRYLKFLKELGIKLPVDYRDIETPRVPLKEPVVFEKKELLKLFHSFPLKSPKRDTRMMAWSMRAFHELLFGSCLRSFEALNLKLSQLPEIKSNRELIIKTKGGGERRIYFTGRALNWIDRYLNQRKETYGFKNDSLFVNGFGNPLKYVTLKSYWLRNKEKWGIGNKWRSHTLRRTGTTMLYEKGMDLKSLQAVGGWKSERTILRHYIFLNQRKAKKKFMKVSQKLF